MNGTRNTPTCVGKTGPLPRRVRLPRKHPHVRGEDPYVGAIARFRRETPPRAWGRPFQPRNWRYWKGNTPTCVGKTICGEG